MIAFGIFLSWVASTTAAEFRVERRPGVPLVASKYKKPAHDHIITYVETLYISR
jgi:hypothetical protein